MIPPQNNDLIRQNEKLKVELREAQRQLQKMKAAAANSERSSPEGGGGEGKGSPDPEDGELSEGQLIMRLKNQGRHRSICFQRYSSNKSCLLTEWLHCVSAISCLLLLFPYPRQLCNLNRRWFSPKAAPSLQCNNT